MKLLARRRRRAVLTVLALVAVLAPSGPAAADDEALEVSPELGTFASGEAAELEATITPPVSNVGINFEVETGPADPDGPTPGTPDATCVTSNGSCLVAISTRSVGTSRVRAWVASEAPDDGEGRLSGIPIAGLLAYDDCRDEDDAAGCRQGTAEPGSGSEGGPLGLATTGDGTDVVEIMWGGLLDCDDSNPRDGEDTEFNLPGQAETYSCRLLDAGGAQVSAAGTLIDAEVDGENDPGADGALAGPADFDNACTIGPDGRCSFLLPAGAGVMGKATVCFWVDSDADNAFDADAGQSRDGGGCVGQEQPDGPEGNNQVDLVAIDWNPPSAALGGVDAQPDLVTQGPGGGFRLAARVYDQFGQPVAGPTAVHFELFAGSPFDRNQAGQDDGNTPAAPDRECQAAPDCTIDFPATFALGHNLICVWTNDPPPPMAGDSRNGACDGEERFDPTFDDGAPLPAGDDRDVVDLFVQSRPALVDVAPRFRRPSATSAVSLALTGVGFLGGAQVAISGTGVTVRSTEFVSANQLRVSVAVQPDAPGGVRDVVVTNTDGGVSTCSGCFQVVGPGYWLVATDGGIFSYGDANFHGSTGAISLNKPILAMAATPSGLGYWIVASDGGVFAYGDATFHGSAGSTKLNGPVVGMAATPSGKGYWLAAADGGIFNYGDARFRGSAGRLRLNAPVVGMAATPNGGGYWLVGADGGIFDFGNAEFHGSTGATKLNSPIVGMAATPSGKGYWLVAADGGIFAYGDAVFHGSTGSLILNSPIVGMAATPTGDGYWLVAADGGIFAFGAPFYGSAGATRLNRPVVGMARR